MTRPPMNMPRSPNTITSPSARNRVPSLAAVAKSLARWHARSEEPSGYAGLRRLALLPTPRKDLGAYWNCCPSDLR